SRLLLLISLYIVTSFLLLAYSRSRLFFFDHPAPAEIYTLSLHDALPICFVDELRIPVEQAVPQAFSDQRDAIVAGLVLACQERAAKKWLHAHYVKIIHGNKRARYALGATLSCEVEAAAEVSGHAGE